MVGKEESGGKEGDFIDAVADLCVVKSAWER